MEVMNTKDIVQYIFSFLDYEDLANMTQICSLWRNLVQEDKRIKMIPVRVPYLISTFDALESEYEYDGFRWIDVRRDQSMLEVELASRELIKLASIENARKILYEHLNGIFKVSETCGYHTIRNNVHQLTLKLAKCGKFASQFRETKYMSVIQSFPVNERKPLVSVIYQTSIKQGLRKARYKVSSCTVESLIDCLLGSREISETNMFECVACIEALTQHAQKGNLTITKNLQLISYFEQLYQQLDSRLKIETNGSFVDTLALFLQYYLYVPCFYEALSLLDTNPCLHCTVNRILKITYQSKEFIPLLALLLPTVDGRPLVESGLWDEVKVELYCGEFEGRFKYEQAAEAILDLWAHMIVNENFLSNMTLDDLNRIRTSLEHIATECFESVMFDNKQFFMETITQLWKMLDKYPSQNPGQCQQSQSN